MQPNSDHNLIASSSLFQCIRVLGIARSSFYYWRATAAERAARQAADARLAARIRAVHRESDGTYGVPRITTELRETGERVNHKRIARVMRSRAAVSEAGTVVIVQVGAPFVIRPLLGSAAIRCS